MGKDRQPKATMLKQVDLNLFFKQSNMILWHSAWRQGGSQDCNSTSSTCWHGIAIVSIRTSCLMGSRLS